MELQFSDINWFAVVAAIIAGQIISTIWFVPLFGESWAREYGVESRQQHSAAIPGYTYAVQLLCTAITVVSLALLQRALGVDTIAKGLGLGVFVAIGFVIVNGLPGQAFLKRWRVAAISMGCQSVMVVAVSLILAAWQ